MQIKKQTIEKFLDELSSKKPTPGGGAAAALAGAVAAGLVEMVASLTFEKKGYARVSKESKKIRDKTLLLRKQLLKLADEDIAAFDAVVAVYKTKNKFQIRKSLKKAAAVPARVASLSRKIEGLAKTMARIGNKNAVSDARSAIHLARAAYKAAEENVKINLRALASLK